MKIPTLCAAAVLILAACGSDADSGSGGDAAAADDQTVGSGGDATVDGDAVADAELTPSPLGILLGYDQSDPEASQEQARADEQQRQDLVAACMTDLGFEYVAWVDPQVFTVPAAPDGLEWGSPAWTERYGYGVTTQWFSQDEVGPELIGYVSGGTVEPTADPNAAIVEALSESELAAYQEALWGEANAEAAVTMSESEAEGALTDWVPSGCFAESEEQLTGASTEFFEQYGDALFELSEEIEADPRLVEFEAGIEACVAEQGIEYVPSSDYWEVMNPVYEEIAADAIIPGSELTDSERETMTQEEIDEIFAQPVVLGETAKARLAEVQAAELQLAAATVGCGGGDVAYAQLYSEVQAELEQVWLDEHPEVVVALSDGG